MHTAGTEVPEVYASLIDDTILVELSIEHAEVLAKVLAHYDTMLAEQQARPADGYVHEVWHHTLVRLLAERAKIHEPADHRPDLRVIGGAQ